MVFIPASAGAVVTPPAEALWAIPSDAATGTAIELNAFVYNNTKNDISATVVFSSGDADIATTVVAVPKESGKTAVAAWTMPQAPAVVTAAITKASNTKDKKEVPALKGVIGTVAVGTVAPVEVAGFPGVAAIKLWLVTHFAGIETWRMAQADHFAAIRDEAKRDLGITIARTIETRVAREIAGVEPDQAVVAESQNNPKDYVILVGATSLASLLGSMWMFYAVAVILSLFIIRFILGRFI